MLRGYRSPLAIGIASLCLLAQISPLIHFLVVPHTRCEVHGATIHASEHEAAPEVGQPARDATSHAVSPAAEHPDEHDHCEVLAALREPCCAPAADTASAPLGVDDSVVLKHASPSSLRPLFRLAPKLSPPHAA
jgi:hypothetical protein